MLASGAELLTASLRGAFFWFADFQRGAFLLAGGQIAADQGRNGPDQRQGTAPRAGPLPATDNGHAGSADSGRTAGRASQGQPSRS